MMRDALMFKHYVYQAPKVDPIWLSVGHGVGRSRNCTRPDVLSSVGRRTAAKGVECES